MKLTLSDEIDSIKERENSLKITNKLLEQSINEQKRANLDSLGSRVNLSNENNEI